MARRNTLDSDDEPSGRRSGLNYRPSGLLDIFQLSRTQQILMSAIIRSAIRDIVKQRNSDGHPLRWCYVPTMPTGRVSGKCLALDFGCSNHFIQVSLCDVHRKSFRTVDNRAFLLTPTLRHAGMEQFCDFLAACLKQILQDNNAQCTADGDPIFMGVAAGFDVRVRPQRRPASATVIASSKDFQMPGFLGHDFVPAFHAAFKRAGLNIQIATVINDTVGTLLAGVYNVASHEKYASYDCSIGVLCHRAGSNMAYLETDRDFLDMCSYDERQLLLRPGSNVLCAAVNTEAGYWIGANGELDELANLIENYIHGTLKSAFRLECITSGAWYPHILYRSIQILSTTKVINAVVDKRWRLDQSKCFEIFVHCDKWRSDKDSPTALSLAAELQPILGVEHLSAEDASLIADVCHGIVGRTASAIAIGIMAIADRIYGKALPRKMAIAYGGTLFKSVSQLEQLLKTSLESMVSSDTEIKLLYSEVLVGCAMTALNAGQEA